MAQAAEKVHSATAELESAIDDARQESRSLVVLEGTLDELKDEQARLTERVSRLPVVETELRSAAEQLETSFDENRRLSSSEAQKAQSVESLREHLEALQSVSFAISKCSNGRTMVV